MVSSQVILRKLEPSDLPYLYAWENDDAAWPDGATHNPLSQQDLRDYIESTTGDFYRDGQIRLIIVSEGLSVGCIDLFDYDARNRKAALGLYIAPEYRGNHLAESALQQVEQLASRHLGLRLLYAIIAENNSSCCHLFDRVEYNHVATLPAWTLEAAARVYQKIF